MLALDSTIYRPVPGSKHSAASGVMRRLAFLPKTLNQFSSCWDVLDEINAAPGVQRALGHSSFHPSIRGPIIVTKNLGSIRCGCDSFRSEEHTSELQSPDQL